MLLNTLGLGNCLLSQTLLQPWYKRNAHGITSWAFLFCYREALCGNSVGTLWELFGGTLHELFGNSSGTLWEQGDIFNFVVLYIVQIRYDIPHRNYLVLYSLTNCIVSCIVQYLYSVQYSYSVQYQRVVQWEVNSKRQHSTSILCIRLALDNHYGTIIS
jgi:hypothetical protein